MFKYIKIAFRNRWNLLALAGSVGVALISGQPEIVLPLVLAAETAYLGYVGTHPKFQKYVDVQEAQLQREVHSQQNEAILARIRHGLPKELLFRFNQLRQRCQHLRRLAADLKHPQFDDLDSTLDSVQIAGLDRLLWVFLRLLFTYHSLATFLQDTSLERMQDDQSKLETRLKEIDANDQRVNQIVEQLISHKHEIQQVALDYKLASQGTHEFMAKISNILIKGIGIIDQQMHILLGKIVLQPKILV